MTYQMSFNLTDQEYAALQAAASREGVSVEAVVREALAPLIAPSTPVVSAPPTKATSEIIEHLHRIGLIMNIATHEKSTTAEEAMLEELAHLFAGGKSAADMVIEDRGPL